MKKGKSTQQLYLEKGFGKNYDPAIVEEILLFKQNFDKIQINKLKKNFKSYD